MFESLFETFCKIGTLFKFSWYKSNSSSVHIGDTHNHHYQSKNDPLGKIITEALAEAKYNETPGIGDPKCPFRLDAHHKLVTADPNLPKEIIDLISTITRWGGLCNGGRIGGEAKPGTVKEKSKELRITLTKFIESQNS